MKQKIIGTGLSGMIGSRIVELLSDRYEFEDLSLEEGVDIRERKKVEKRIGKSKAKVVFHLAAKTDVDSCERDKKEDMKKLRNLEIKDFKKINLSKVNWSLWQNSNSAWAVNAMGTKNVAKVTEKSGKKIIYISTDFVFDGIKSPDEGYTEKDTPHPINWYGQTKYEGERIVKSLKTPSLILRLAFPFRAFFPKKKDFVRSILEKFEKGEKIKAVSDQIITPTFIDDIAIALDILIKKEASGLYHLVGSQSLSPFKAVCLIASQFGLDTGLVSSVKMDNYYKGRASRPKNLAIGNKKIKKLDIKMRTFKAGLKETKKQIQEPE